MSSKVEESMIIGNLTERSFSIDENIYDFKFHYKDIEYQIDINIVYTACKIFENIQIRVFNKTNKITYSCEIQVNDLFLDTMLLKLEENSNIYKVNLYFFYLLLKNSFSNSSNCNLVIEMKSLDQTSVNLNLSAVGFYDYELLNSIVLNEAIKEIILKEFLIMKISFKNKKLCHNFQINLQN